MNFYRIEYLAKYFSTASNQLSRFSFPSTHFVYINIYTKYIYTNNIYTNIYTTNCVSWNARLDVRSCVQSVESTTGLGNKVRLSDRSRYGLLLASAARGRAVESNGCGGRNRSHRLAPSIFHVGLPPQQHRSPRRSSLCTYYYYYYYYYNTAGLDQHSIRSLITLPK